MQKEFQSLPLRQLHLRPTASASRGASWSAVAEMPEPSGIGDTAVERPTVSASRSSRRAPDSGVALTLPTALHDASRHSQVGRRPSVFGGGRVDDTLRSLHRTTRLMGGFFTCKSLYKPSGRLAKKVMRLATPTAPNTPDLHLSRRATAEQSGPRSPLCGAPSADGRSLAALSPRAEDFGVWMANENAPAFHAPHRGLCGPLFSRLALIACVALSACDKQPEAVKPAPEAPKAAAISNTELDAVIADALSSPAPTPASPAELSGEAASILAKYPGKNASELLSVPEVNESLKIALGKLAQDKALQAKINSSVDLAAQIKGLEGAARLDLDMTKYDQARTSRMLQSVLSEDPAQIVSFLVGEIGEAAPDISYGGLERAPNGVSIVPNPAAATPAKTDSPE